MFKKYSIPELIPYIGKVVEYKDIYGNISKSRLDGNNSKIWLSDAACLPFVENMYIKL